jgi:hypothetical protein
MESLDDQETEVDLESIPTKSPEDFTLVLDGVHAATQAAPSAVSALA